MLKKEECWFEYKWLNKGELDIGRDYRLFAILADVRNYLNVKPISRPKLDTNGDDEYERYRLGDFKNSFSEVTANWMQGYGADGHSHSYLTLAEILAADFDQEVQWGVGGSDAKPGKYREGFDFEEYEKIVAAMQELRGAEYADDEVRIVFFFDN